MNRTFLLLLLLILLIIWLVIGVFYCTSRFCGGTSCGPWDYSDGNAFKTEADSYIKFENSKALPLAFDSSIKDAFKKTANYLKEHPDRLLTVTGYYDSDEKFDSKKAGFANLGAARANSVKNSLEKYGVPTNQIKLASYDMDKDGKDLAEQNFNDDVLCRGVDFSFNKGQAVAKAAPAAAGAAAVAASTGWIVRDQAKNVTNKAEIFNFKRSTNDMEVPKVTDDGFREVASYLKRNPKKKLDLKGYYLKNEKNGSKFNNLGIGRAEAVKARLIKYGAPAAVITTTGIMSSKLNFNKNDRLLGGVDFNFLGSAPAAVDNNRIAAAKNLVGKNIIMYFATNSDQLNMTAAQKKDIADIKYYLENVEGSKLDVSGHTDNVGNRDSNIALSKKRAGFAANFLQKMGIPKSKMVTNGFGPDKPIKDNGTAAGRSQNRRVEIILK